MLSIELDGSFEQVSVHRYDRDVIGDIASLNELRSSGSMLCRMQQIPDLHQDRFSDQNFECVLHSRHGLLSFRMMLVPGIEIANNERCVQQQAVAIHRGSSPRLG